MIYYKILFFIKARREYGFEFVLEVAAKNSAAAGIQLFQRLAVFASFCFFFFFFKGFRA